MSRNAKIGFACGCLGLITLMVGGFVATRGPATAPPEPALATSTSAPTASTSDLQSEELPRLTPGGEAWTPVEGRQPAQGSAPSATPGPIGSREEALARIMRNGRLARGAERSDAKRTTLGRWMEASGNRGAISAPHLEDHLPVWVVAVGGNLDLGAGAPVPHRSYEAVLDANTGLLIFEHASVQRDWPRGFNTLPEA